MLAVRRFAQALSAACAHAGMMSIATPALGQVPLINGFGGPVGYGTQCLSPNDDGSGPQIDLTPAFGAQGLHFFSNFQTHAYVNTNGNISFNGPVPTYTPNAFPVASQPMIAPYWGDVDIRLVNGVCQGSAGQGCVVCQPCTTTADNGVWWYLEPGRMVVTWDRDGYFTCHNDLRMSFQLILTTAGCGGAGDFDVEFRFNRCEWETGDASQGVNGFGGVEAQSGFDAGDQTNYVAIPGSMAPGISQIMCTQSNVGEPGIWRFQIRSGSVVCPDAGQPCDTGLLGACASGHTNCVGSGTECVQDVQPSAEVCDAIDNDCDGQVDEPDSTLCPDGLFCAAGVCVAPCTEMGCGPGQICDISGMCVEEACQGVVCDQGQRCEGGVCVGACDGVVCPWDRICRAGRCVDACAGQSCDDCTVCKDGLCVSRCQYTPCPTGQTCQDDGSCLEDACVGVTCQAGFHCEGGNCVDSCTGAICPNAQACQVGECIDSQQPDAGSGGGWQDDAGFGGWGFGGSGAGAGNGANGSGNADSGGDLIQHSSCGCRTVGSGRPPAGALLGLAFGAWLAVSRRRRGR